MTAPNDNQNQVRQYLLGSLSEDLQKRVEERLMTEEQFLEELLLAEDELIDTYVGGGLSADERERFTRYFLSTPERRRKLRFGMVFGRYVSEKSAAASGELAEAGEFDEALESEKAAGFAGASRLPVDVPKPLGPTLGERLRAFWSGGMWGLRAAAAFALVAVVSGVVWLVIQQRTPPPHTFATLTLNVGASNRAEGEPASKVKLPPDADALKVSLNLPARATAATRYRAELLTDTGETKAAEIVGQDAQSVSVLVPAAQLARGRYALQLFKTEDGGAEQRLPGNYFFDVE